MAAQPLAGDLHRALARLEAEPERAWTVASLAAACGVAPRTLQKHFRRFLGRTPLAFIRELRLDQARRQLLGASASASVTDVAARCGFNHLGRFPASYRLRHRESPLATLRRRQPALGRRALSPPTRSSMLERPAIAVLPFAAVGPQASRVVGLSDDVAAALVRLHGLNVTVPQNARYQLRGKYRNDSGGLLRVTVILAAVAVGPYVWAESGVGDRNDRPAFEERIVTGIARAIPGALRDAEIDRACRGEPAELNAWELTMRAMPHVLSLEAAGESMALELLEQAMELAPDDALPMAVAAWCHGLRAGHHFTAG